MQSHKTFWSTHWFPIPQEKCCRLLGRSVGGGTNSFRVPSAIILMWHSPSPRTTPSPCRSWGPPRRCGRGSRSSRRRPCRGGSRGCPRSPGPPRPRTRGRRRAGCGSGSWPRRSCRGSRRSCRSGSAAARSTSRWTCSRRTKTCRTRSRAELKLNAWVQRKTKIKVTQIFSSWFVGIFLCRYSCCWPSVC